MSMSSSAHRLACGRRRCGTRACASRPESSDETLRVRVAKARLQQAYDTSVLRRKPRYLPFAECRKWSRAMWMETAQDWEDWLNDGRRNVVRALFSSGGGEAVMAGHTLINDSLTRVSKRCKSRACK